MVLNTILYRGMEKIFTISWVIEEEEEEEELVVADVVLIKAVYAYLGSMKAEGEEKISHNGACLIHDTREDVGRMNEEIGLLAIVTQAFKTLHFMECADDCVSPANHTLLPLEIPTLDNDNRNKRSPQPSSSLNQKAKTLAGEISHALIFRTLLTSPFSTTARDDCAELPLFFENYFEQ
uniref:Uncharacterized protein n=1 Tax=Glossina pallidipes TaxID=7398 RepID=A0A1B0A930_GLOPL